MKIKILFIFIFGFILGSIFVVFFSKYDIRIFPRETVSPMHPIERAIEKAKEVVLPLGKHVDPSLYVLSDFEKDNDLSKWAGNGVHLAVDNHHCLDGEGCLAANFSSDGYFSAWQTLKKNWKGYETLSFDIFNPQNILVKLTLLIKDEIDMSYAERFERNIPLKYGWNHFDFRLGNLKVNGKHRNINISRIKEVVFSSENTALVYFDNIYLKKREQPSSILTKQPTKRILSDFETEGEDVKWSSKDVKISIVKEHCSSGEICLKAEFPKGEYPGIRAEKLSADWSGYDWLKFDVYNPINEIVKFGLSIIDQLGDSYPERYDGYFAFRPGMNNFKFNITNLKTNNKSRNIAFDRMKSVVIFLLNLEKPTDLYFDNIRLEREDAPPIEDMYLFDFGPNDSEGWSGFHQVTPESEYSESTGYGWDSLDGQRGEDRQYPDPLLRDWIRSPVPFRVKVPNGKYHVFLMLEDPGFWEYYQNYDYREITAENKLMGREEMTYTSFLTDYYFKHQDHEDSIGADIFKDYVEQRFSWRRFEVDVQDGILDLQCKPSWGYACTMSALVVAPAEKEKESLNFMKELTNKRKQYFISQFVEDVPLEQTLSVELQHFKEKGFVAFAETDVNQILPNHMPMPSEVKEINIFAAKGEKEHFLVGVYPFSNIEKGMLSIGDLVDEKGNTLSSKNMRIRRVQNKLKLTSKNIYRVQGEMLRDTKETSLVEGKPVYFLVTVMLPEDVHPGQYKSKIIFETKEGRAQSIQLNVEIMPFVLEKPDIPIGLFYSIPRYFEWFEKKEKQWTFIEKHLFDMKEHGMNVLTIDFAPEVKSVDASGHVTLDFTFFDEFLRVYQKFGFEKPIVGYGTIGLIKAIESLTGEVNHQKMVVALHSAFRQIQDHVNDFSHVDFIFVLADEVSNLGGPGIEKIKNLTKISSQIKGVTTTAFLNGKEDSVVFPELQIATVNDGMDINQNLIDKAQKAGTDLWFYNLGKDRLTYGYYLWKTKAKGRLEWHYQLPAVDPYFDLDGRESDFCASYPSREGPINALWFEVAREGIDDYRYILTLSSLIERVEKISREDAQKAKKVLDSILQDVDVALNQNAWSPEMYRFKRRKISDEIIRLQTVLKEATPKE